MYNLSFIFFSIGINRGLNIKFPGVTIFNQMYSVLGVLFALLFCLAIYFMISPRSSTSLVFVAIGLLPSFLVLYFVILFAPYLFLGFVQENWFIVGAPLLAALGVLAFAIGFTWTFSKKWNLKG